MKEYPLDDFESLYPGELPGQVTKVFMADALPEHCPFCKHEFIYDIQSTVPPTADTECKCGQWRVVIAG